MKSSRWIWQLVSAGALAATLAGVGGAGQALATSRTSTDVGVGILQSAASADGTLTYVVTAVNDGNDRVKNTTITVPFDAQALAVVDVSLSDPASQASAADAGTIKIQTGRLSSSGGSVQATLRFHALPGHAGASLTERASYSWSQGSGVSNVPAAGQAALDIQLANGIATINSTAFGTFEPVTYWYNTPDGQVVATRIRDNFLVNAQTVAAEKARYNQKANHGVFDEGIEGKFADDQGNVSVQMSTVGLAPGTYSLVARGNTSGLIAVGSLEVK